MISYHRVKTDQELREILELQELNLGKKTPFIERSKEGFVTLQHDFEMLKKMNDQCAHCVAKKNGKVVAYVLAMLQDFKRDIPLLVPMFDEIDKELEAHGKGNNDIVMGQTCIAKVMRGKGVFRGLYLFMCAQLKGSFDRLITEVDVKNIRSSGAHRAIGFELLKNHTLNRQVWEIISLKI